MVLCFILNVAASEIPLSLVGYLPMKGNGCSNYLEDFGWKGRVTGFHFWRSEMLWMNRATKMSNFHYFKKKQNKMRSLFL